MFDANRPNTIVITDTAGNELDTIVIRDQGMLTDALPVTGSVSALARQADMSATADGGLVLGHQWDGILRRFSATGDIVWSVSIGADTFDDHSIMGIDVAPDGTIWAAVEQDEAWQFSGADGSLLTKITAIGSSTSDIVGLSDGSVAVATQGGVKHYSGAGALLGSILGESWMSIEQGPDDRLWGTATSSHSIRYVNVNGTGAGNFGVSGYADGQITDQTDLDIDASGDVWVVENKGASRAQRFNSSGVFEARLGPGDTGLHNPTGVAAAANDQTVVAVPSAPFIRVLNASGATIASFGAAGAGPGQFGGVVSLEVAADNTIWAVDSTQMLIHHFALDGTVMGTIDTSAESVTGTSIGVASDGSIVVGDTSTGSVAKYSTAGVLQAQWGGLGATDGLFNSMTRIEGSADGFIYVADSDDGRLQQFTNAGAHVATNVIDALSASSGASGYSIMPDHSIVHGSFSGLHLVDPSTGSEVSRIGVRTTVDGPAVGHAVHVDLGADGDIALVESISASRISRWRKDDTAPSATASSSVGASSITFTAVATDNERLAIEAYSWDNGATWVAAPTATVTGLAAGTSTSKTLKVRDSAGNISAGQVVTGSIPETTTPTTPIDPDPTFSVSLGATVPSGVIPAGQTTLQFTISGASGSTSGTARFGGKSVPLTADGLLRLGQLPEGKGQLNVVITDASGASTTWVKTIIIDRTAPNVLAPSRYVLGSSTNLTATDLLTGVTRKPGRWNGLTLGRNERRVRVSDRAGNTAARTVVVTRRLALTSARANRGIDLGGGQASDAHINDIFSFDRYSAPWYESEPLGAAYVRETRWRLAQLGYLPLMQTGSGHIDWPLMLATKHYQRAKGLPQPGTIGPRTRAALDRDLSTITGR